jgi:DEAD/DEAH box helicase domain-containing protein
MNQLVVDLETKRSFDEVGGRHLRAELGVSVVGVYHYRDNRFETYREEAFATLEAELRAADLIVGFNLVAFDWPVLAGTLGDWVLTLPTRDLMIEVQKSLGHRVSLDVIARETLGKAKLGSGLDALEYYRERDWVNLERYCLEDVRLTRDLYEYALKHGHLLYKRRNKQGVIKVDFSENKFEGIFLNAARDIGSVRVVYNGRKRLVDVHRFNGTHIRAYCHLRRAILTFRIDRVEEAEPVTSEAPVLE